MAESMLKLESISKEFSGVPVLNNIDIEIEKGEIFGIIGENGAGKSTLVKIIGGIYQPSKGNIYIQGEKVEIRNSIIAKKMGISMIAQELNLIETLNVFENIFLGYEYIKGILLNKKVMKEKTKELLKELKTEISPNAMIRDLSIAQKQMVEISKALAHESKVLIMDEPTTVLTKYEIGILYDLMKELKKKGVTILFISHKLKEVKKICDRVMILRDGDLISTDEIGTIDEHEMARRMVGRELYQRFPEKIVPTEETVLKVEDFSVDGFFSGVNFELKKGEVLGFAGLIGAGRTELAETIMGLRRKSRGRILLYGKEVTINSPADAVNDKIGYLSEDRKGKGIVLNFDIPKNITLISLPRYSDILIHKSQERSKTKEYIKTFDIRSASLSSELRLLSGGNQQKVYLSKWMDTEPQILILDEPTRGIDVNAKSVIYQFIHSLSQKGISCILISSELEEIIGMCTRVYVMREGKITGILTGNLINEEEIMFYAAGLKERREIHGAVQGEEKV
ncbi:MAG: sugar ABC transporter ATP-binding protein [Chlamydiota bacterium]